ncbi:MAG: threonine/serine exporter family protein, partial [archaeon]|nr:threonine/serine exporter family protein [archaeon]
EVRSESLHVTMTQGLDCAALQDYADLSAQIAFRQLDLVEGLMRIRQISERPPLFGNEISLISFAAMAGLAPLAFYGGGIFDAIFSTLLGTVIGLFLIYLSGIGRIANITPFLAAAFASFSSTAVASAMPPGYTFCPLSCTLSALLWLLPGLGLTTGIAELAVKSIISGSSRFFSAMICAVQLGYGIVIGSEIVAWYDQADASLQRALHEGCSLAPSPFLLPLFLVLISLTFNILLNCPLSIWVFTSGAALLGGGLFALLGGGGYAVMDDQLALAVSSFAVGVCGQLVALIRGHQSLVTIICGILVLVPGGYASRTAASLLTQPSLDVAMFLLTTVLTAFSLTIGLLAAKALIPSTPHRLRAPIYKSHQIPPNASLLELI